MDSQFICGVCLVAVSGEDNYRQHVKGRPHKKKEDVMLHPEKYPLFCHVCHVPFSSEGNAAQHYKSIDHKLKVDRMKCFLCKSCQLAFDTEDEFTTHCESHSRRTTTFDCVECDKSFNSKEDLQTHTWSLQHVAKAVSLPKPPTSCFAYKA